MAWLPANDGLLPWWMLLVSAVSIGNSIQTYSTLHFTKQVYLSSPSPVTPLSSRTFGTWTFITSIVRLYAAYNIHNPKLYELAMWTYVVALGHFASEWGIFRTAHLGRGLVGPLVVSTTTLCWMITQWSFYVDDSRW